MDELTSVEYNSIGIVGFFCSMSSAESKADTKRRRVSFAPKNDYAPPPPTFSSSPDASQAAVSTSSRLLPSAPVVEQSPKKNAAFALPKLFMALEQQFHALDSALCTFQGRNLLPVFHKLQPAVQAACKR